jgi:hypothetical protein
MPTTSPGRITLRLASAWPQLARWPETTGCVMPGFSPPALVMAAIISP